LHVKWLERALPDLDDAEAYISQTDPLAAEEVVLKIIKAVSLLEEQPGLGRAGRVLGTRELVIPNTRYIVPYRVKDDSLQILRVYHSSRIWPRRI
jgi:toxin ParE1/3/4